MAKCLKLFSKMNEKQVPSSWQIELIEATFSDTNTETCWVTITTETTMKYIAELKRKEEKYLLTGREKKKGKENVASREGDWKPEAWIWAVGAGDQGLSAHIGAHIWVHAGRYPYNCTTEIRNETPANVRTFKKLHSRWEGARKVLSIWVETASSLFSAVSIEKHSSERNLTKSCIIGEHRVWIYTVFVVRKSQVEKLT